MTQESLVRLQQPVAPTADAREPESPRPSLKTSRVSEWLLRREFAGPLLKQTPVAGMFVIAIALTELVPSIYITDDPVYLWSIALMIVATVLAAVLSSRERFWRFEHVVPAMDFAAIGLLRLATGDSLSLFTILVVFPVIWFASSLGRRNILYAFGGALLVFLIPVFLEPEPLVLERRVLRAVFASTVLGAAAVVVNELSLLARRLVDAARDSERQAQEELERAAEVQRALQPSSNELVGGWQIAGACLTSRVVSGDFYDWYRIEGGFAVTLGDVMGKGAGAGMIAATARAVVRSKHRADDPVEAVSRASRSLATDLEDTTTFATMFHARIRTSDGRMRWVDAGHGLTIVVHPDGSFTRLASFDLPLGLATSDEEWTSRELQLEPGELLVTVSDGILDLYSGGVDSLERVAELTRTAETAEAAVERVRDLAEAGSLDDDITVVVVRRAALDA
ncbi:PP2C family protein-serine/threonine phosphatase [Desertivibrio insolitus]|uniref:PP2C family protein-serine/threonine phosphatase n=1 Tax=Herbiconiux sp. SYSU D00978 TaxID=2812562 RepID=UPI001A96DE38|nr:SpoIIE family protein phosphatase [Herbiconiux sp. SYSU D00978]